MSKIPSNTNQLTNGASFVKVKSKEYTITTSSTLDVVSQRYSGSVYTGADKPSTCVALFAVVKSHPGYENCDAAINQIEDTIWVNHRNANEKIVVVQYWLYT